MKKLLMIATLSIFSFNSFATDLPASCPDLYQSKILEKDKKKDRAELIATGLGASGFILALGAPAIGLAILVPAAALDIYASIPSKEKRVMRILEEGNKNLVKLTKKMQKNVSSQITADEILDLVRDGLESGEFCKNYPDLHSPSDVKKYVEASMKAKYGNPY